MNVKLSRRLFLASTITIGACMAIPGWGSLNFQKKEPVELIEEILYRRLPFLNLDQVGVKKFANDYYQKIPELFEQLSDVEWYLRPIGTLVKPDGVILKEHNWDTVEEQLISYYLISSDFFWNQSNESLPVRYLGLHDVYAPGCTNPFAQFEEKESLA